MRVQRVSCHPRIDDQLKMPPSIHGFPDCAPRIGTAHFFARRFNEAVPKLLLAIQEDPSFPPPYRILASCYAHMGRLDEARAIVAKLRAITPEVVPTVLPYRNTDDRELYLSGLRLAAGDAQ